MKVAAVISLKADHRLPVLLDVAGLARSTFFYHQAKASQSDPKADLKAAITTVFEDSRSRYGYRRVRLVLIGQGWTVSKKTVLKIMRELGLASKARRRKRFESYRGQVGRVAENILDRNFLADAPNCKWVTDVTEFRVGERKIYLSPVMDLYDHSIVSYAHGLSPSLELTTNALREALGQLADGQTPLVHSDQGFQYQHQTWTSLLGQAGAIQSMSRKATCLDNAVMENFFGHMKEEMFNHDRYDSIDELAAAIDEYIDWYNHERISTKLEGLTPVQYRAQALAA